jgi:hypothetical protein
MNDYQRKWQDRYLDNDSMVKLFKEELSTQNELLIELIRKTLTEQDILYPNNYGEMSLVNTTIIDTEIINAICINREIKTGALVINSELCFILESDVLVGYHNSSKKSGQADNGGELINMKFKAVVVYVLLKHPEKAPIMAIESIVFAVI